MIITKTPFRLSLLGGGTDYPEWFINNGGFVVGGTINRYAYVAARYLPPMFDYKSRIAYSKIELVNDNNDIEHDVVRKALEFVGVKDGVEITYMADLPSKTGVGSSSTFTVGLLQALYSMTHQYPSKKQLASDAIRLEQFDLRECVGSQDQTWAAYGGLNTIEFQRRTGEIIVSPLPVSPENQALLEGSILLCYTGIMRRSAHVASSYVPSLKQRTEQQKWLTNAAKQGAQHIVDGKIDELGKLVGQSWTYKRSLSDAVSNPLIDDMYQRALDAGAFGGKVIGAGGGGFMLLIVDPDRMSNVKLALQDCAQMHIRFEFNGTRSILMDKQDAITKQAHSSNWGSGILRTPSLRNLK